jgi:hypothetical protein
MTIGEYADWTFRSTAASAADERRWRRSPLRLLSPVDTASIMERALIDSTVECFQRPWLAGWQWPPARFQAYRAKSSKVVIEESLWLTFQQGKVIVENNPIGRQFYASIRWRLQSIPAHQAGRQTPLLGCLAASCRPGRLRTRHLLRCEGIEASPEGKVNPLVQRRLRLSDFIQL